MANTPKPSGDMLKLSDKILNHTGRCLCGKVTYKLDGPMVYNVLCHCENCRHVTGTLFLTATIIPKEVRSYIL
jgi:hypothetical protein